MNIQIIEDDPINSKLINVILSSAGHKIYDYDMGSKALQGLSSDKPDIILVDLVLPDMSGTKLAELIRKDESTSHIPIIAITGYPEQFRQRDIVFSGFDAYIVKPINTRVLIDMIEGVILSGKKKKAINIKDS